LYVARHCRTRRNKIALKRLEPTSTPATSTRPSTTTSAPPATSSAAALFMENGQLFLGRLELKALFTYSPIHFLEIKWKIENILLLRVNANRNHDSRAMCYVFPTD
jgi:hypothetical protein